MSDQYDNEPYDIPANVPAPVRTLAPMDIPELPPEADMLAFTNAMRMNVLGQMFGPGNRLPEDPADRKTIAGILKDIDGQTLTRMRIKVDEKQNNNQEQAAGIIAQLLNAAAGANPFQIAKPLNRAAPRLPDSIPDPILVEGEVSTQTSQMSYDTFVAEHSPPQD